MATSLVAKTSSIAGGRFFERADLPAYSLILDRASTARVVVLTYPTIFSDTDEFECGVYISLDAGERRWLRDRNADLRDVIVDAVDSVRNDREDGQRLEVLDELSAFEGHDICASEPYANAGVVTEPDDSFHPTAAGYRHMAEDLAGRVASWLRASGRAMTRRDIEIVVLVVALLALVAFIVWLVFAANTFLHPR